MSTMQNTTANEPGWKANPEQIAMGAGLPYTALRDTILTHPTLVEGLIPLFLSAPTTPAVQANEARAGGNDKSYKAASD
jgi:hypothetical protein